MHLKSIQISLDRQKLGTPKMINNQLKSIMISLKTLKKPHKTSCV